MYVVIWERGLVMSVIGDVQKDEHGFCVRVVGVVQNRLLLVWQHEDGVESRHEVALFFRYSLMAPSYLCPE
jgi:hypothetical protein